MLRVASAPAFVVTSVVVALKRAVVVEASVVKKLAVAWHLAVVVNHVYLECYARYSIHNHYVDF